MKKFRVGDKVIRINSTHWGMKPGDTSIITKVFEGFPIHVELKDYDGEHSVENLEIINSLLNNYEIY